MSRVVVVYQLVLQLTLVYLNLVTQQLELARLVMLLVAHVQEELLMTALLAH